MGSLHPSREDLLKVLCGNTNAADFIESVFGALHLWDDLIDRDKRPSDADISAAFINMLVALPSNPFYLNNISSFRPLLLMAIVDWHTATRFERNELVPDDQRQYELSIAFILRSSYVSLLLMAAFICGGMQHVLAVSPDIRRMFHDEEFEGYLCALEDEKKAREGK